MRVVVDRQRCVGSGLCVLSAPHSFEQSERDGLVLPLAAPDPAGSGAWPDQAGLARVRTAVRLCPSGALSLAEER